MEQVMVKWLVGRKDSCHLVVVGRMDVLINTVAGELHLPQREGKGQKSPGGSPGGGRGRCTIGTHSMGQSFDLCSPRTPSPHAETRVFFQAAL